jgi:hypothetical protein
MRGTPSTQLAYAEIPKGYDDQPRGTGPISRPMSRSPEGG